MPALGNYSAADVRAAVGMPAAVSAVREAFAGLAAGHFSQPPRLVLGTDDQAVMVMTAHHGPSGAAVVKTAGVVLGRDPAILATLVWTDDGGQLTAEAGAVTALRTGAAAGVATDLLAAPDANRLALLGAGAQAADQVRAVLAVRKISELTVWNRTARRVGPLLDELSAEFPGLRVRAAGSAAEAVAGADVVCCATSAEEPLFELSALPERVHVNAIGSFRASMRELPAELLATASTVLVDQFAAAADAGEIRHALDRGLLERSGVLDLGNALAEPPEATGRTVFKSVGVAAQDWAIARLLAQHARH
ncbi:MULTISPECIES: ornithine cyclodeaminase family protein [Amycolatopsis]|uniref:Ornithine cyclodeaminase family protein n=1 Tax=Amycolatopsis dendrobii TaxID=2760662 RepID=A0A7W3W401_9PSEU|nr:MULTISPECIES: ornithine cyclodeaminase family protein [Amycolatopsis]MBB1158424.1 ornithine cyclodeaminase family protein [Amycolatopsis dendrobii]UKD56928.1 ornithine cyclodeaminase family protein [Amycolatopsis sp. FU40]